MSINATITINVITLITARPITNPVLELSSADVGKNGVITEMYKKVVTYDCILLVDTHMVPQSLLVYL